jgi:hypothetical protein
MRVLLKIRRAGRVGGLYVMLAPCMGASEYVLAVLGVSGDGEVLSSGWFGMQGIGDWIKIDLQRGVLGRRIVWE